MLIVKMDRKTKCWFDPKFHSHIKSIVHKKNIKSRVNNDVTDRKYIFDDPDVYQLDDKIDETMENYCMQYFQKFK